MCALIYFILPLSHLPGKSNPHLSYPQGTTLPPKRDFSQLLTLNVTGPGEMTPQPKGLLSGPIPINVC